MSRCISCWQAVIIESGWHARVSFATIPLVQPFTVVIRLVARIYSGFRCRFGRLRTYCSSA